jgi:hypothetical protein
VPVSSGPNSAPTPTTQPPAAGHPGRDQGTESGWGCVCDVPLTSASALPRVRRGGRVTRAP